MSFNLGLARNSVGKDLNQLWNDGTAVSRGRPVYFCIAGRWKRCWDDGWKSLNAKCGRWRILLRMSITRPTIRLPA